MLLSILPVGSHTRSFYTPGWGYHSPLNIFMAHAYSKEDSQVREDNSSINSTGQETGATAASM